jgi:hypothetical protein
MNSLANQGGFSSAIDATALDLVVVLCVKSGSAGTIRKRLTFTEQTTKFVLSFHKKVPFFGWEI